MAGIIPSVIWIYFWVKEDKEHPEPRSLLIFTFLGGMGSVLLAIFAERAIAEAVASENTRYFLWASVEEAVKFLAVFLIALNSDFNDEPIDAMIYFIIAALGFAAVENVLFALNPASGGSLATSIVSSNLRFIGATVVHVVSSATIGFALGLVFYKGLGSKVLAGIVGFVASVALHAAFNLSIIDAITVADALQVFAWFWGAIVILLILFEEIKAVHPNYLKFKP